MLAIIFGWPSSAAPAANTVFFSDLQGHWALSHIIRLAALDAAKGNPDHTFKPEQRISQLETMALFMKSGGFDAEAEQLARAT